ncbi:hypothetical protein HCN44_006163 [Aphidius gifuensis]|uniref:Thyroglobulin type-1 domain-containing protein n=1 Tax=Aphidius gifuensis TaxID=684658 RepID=A0A835CVL6_APHGI|nr:hypothetical protein HCN44_006163 [Aphidius gifuensis]
MQLFELFIFLIIFKTTICTDCQESVGINENCKCSKCLPGLICSPDDICVIDKGTCESQKWEEPRGLWTPCCDKDTGDYCPRQCKGEYRTGRCFCYNSKGSRIFGSAWWKDAANMTCACSRKREELKNSRPDLSIHCTENGNYDELQCDNGLCWCVVPETGKLVEKVYPESMMKLLPCYNETKVGSQYLRQCESKKISRAEILDKLKKHGRPFAHIDDAFCDGDGSYGVYKLSKKVVFCTWKDSSRLDNYQSTTANILSMNCNCARDMRIYQENKMSLLLSCEGNGNYEKLQTSNGYPFCVDDDGYATTPLGPFGETCDCNRRNCSLS